MPERGSAESDVEAVAEISAALKRAGLRVTAAQIVSMVECYRFVQQSLTALGQRLPRTAEPALTFDSGRACRTLRDDDGRR
jgi:hypothetical protein